MLFKYVTTGSGSRHDVRQDIAKILCGETDLNNLSAHCDKVTSGFVNGGSTPDVYFTTEVNNNLDAILKKPHSKAPAIDVWLDLRLNANNMISLCPLEDGTGGIRTNPAYLYDSNHTSYNMSGAISFVSTGVTFYIGMSNSVVFIANTSFTACTFWSEIWEAGNPAETIYKYDNPIVKCWAMGYVGNQGQFRWIGHPKLYGAGLLNNTGSINSPARNNLTPYMSSAVSIGGSEYPQLLPDGRQGMVLNPYFYSGVSQSGSYQTLSIPRFRLGDIYFANIANAGSMIGLRYTNFDGTAILGQLYGADASQEGLPWFKGI